MKHIPEEISQEDGRWLKALFEVATDGIIKINSRGIIENVNLAACTLFGYEEQEMLGQKVNMLMNGDDRTHHDEYLERYESTRTPKIIGIGREVISQRKNGEAFPLRLAVSEVKFDGQVIYAAKYSAPGLNVTITTGHRGDGCFINITDEGIGIPAEDQVHLFDRFFRARNVENVKGTGLGLHIVSHYVHLLEAEIEFSSELGTGSTFTIVLPARKEA